MAMNTEPRIVMQYLVPIIGSVREWQHLILNVRSLCESGVYGAKRHLNGSHGHDFLP